MFCLLSPLSLGNWEPPELSLPYFPAQVDEAIIDENGATLSIGKVTATFGPSCLPQQSRVAMMTAELEPGFKVNGEVSLSPLVVLGPHTGQRLSSSYELSVPLEITRHEEVRVLVSRTSCFELPQWEELSSEQFAVYDDHVVISAADFTRFQAQCGGQIAVKASGEYVYFSVSTQKRPNFRLLKVRWSNDLQDCIGDLGPFRLAHEPMDSKENGIYLSPGEEIDITVEAKNDSIIKLTSPFTKEDFRETLKEDIYLESEKLARGMKWWSRSQVQKPLPWTWRIVPRDGGVRPVGALYAQCVNSSKVEGRAMRRIAGAAYSEQPTQAKVTGKDMATIHFGFDWEEDDKVCALCVANNRGPLHTVIGLRRKRH